MAPQPYAYVYDEKNAVVISASRQLVENSGVMVRRYSEGIPAGKEDAVIREMLAARAYIDNPQTDRRAGGVDQAFRATGRWGVARVWKSGPEEKALSIYEELRLNWLQAPGTPNDYPKSKDATDWTGIDAQARVVRVNEIDISNRALAGENQFYILTIPRVATVTVKEFCTALTNRPAIVDPKFGVQTVVPGTWLFRGAHNEDQGDGSSTVVCALAQADGFVPGSLVMSDGWNQQTIHMFWKHLPTYPAASFPPVNVEAVDAPVLDLAGNSQMSPAIIYQIAGADLDQNGLWNITVIKRVAKPSMVQFNVKDRDGGYTITQFTNQTLRWTKAVVSTLSATLRNQVHPQRNEFNLYDGEIHQQGALTTFTTYYNRGPYAEYVDEFRWDHGGHYIQEEWCITCYYRFDTSVANGLDDFHTRGTPLMRWSYFHELGGDKYRYKLTVTATLKTKDLTSLYNVSSRGSTFQVVAPIT